MSEPTLVIGNKNHSSWSLRPWLLLRHLQIAFTEVRIPLYAPDSAERIRAHSPSGKVPLLRDGANVIWDSLAICEYVAERFPDRHAWPADPAVRAVARSVSAEMHSGFGALRNALPMNCRASGRRVLPTEDVRADIARIQDIWRACRHELGQGGPWLFGRFSIADAMFAPVAYRFATYGVECDATARAWMNAIFALPEIQEWTAAAHAETEVLEQFEVGRAGD